MATRPPSATATPTSETTPWLVSACSCTMEWPAASALGGDLLALHGQRGEGDLRRIVAGGRRRRLIGGGGDQDHGPGDGGQGGGGADEDHGPRMADPGQAGVRGTVGARRHLAGVPPEPVVGVDPAPQRGVGAVGGTARILCLRSLFRWLLGCRGHVVRLLTQKGEMRSGLRPAVPCGPMSRDLAIDLGTANTLVYAKGKGLVLNEPTVVALDSRTREVLAIGTDAWQMIGRTPGYIVAERPLRGGAITDFEVTERMLSVLLHRVGVSRLNRPKVLICVPSAITAVERRAGQGGHPPGRGVGLLSDRAAHGGGHRGRPGHP